MTSFYIFILDLILDSSYSRLKAVSYSRLWDLVVNGNLVPVVFSAGVFVYLSLPFLVPLNIGLFRALIAE